MCSSDLSMVGGKNVVRRTVGGRELPFNETRTTADKIKFGSIISTPDYHDAMQVVGTTARPNSSSKGWTLKNMRNGGTVTVELGPTDKIRLLEPNGWKLADLSE